MELRSWNKELEQGLVVGLEDSSYTLHQIHSHSTAMAGTCWCMDHSHTALDAAIPVAADDHPTHPFQICHTHDPQIAQTHELATKSRQATNLQIAAWNSRSICRDPLERM